MIRAHQQAFTLLELVLAISILSLVMYVSYSSISQLIRSRMVIADNREASALADAILSRITREIQLATKHNRPLRLKLIKPGAAATNAVLLGESTDNGNGLRSDTITFNAREAGQYLPDGGSHTGVVQISYRLEPDPETRNQPRQTMLLIRDELPDINTGASEDEAYKRAMTFPVASNVLSLSLQYYDAQSDQWADTWGDDHPGNLPTLIRFEIVLRTPGGRQERYSTAIFLPKE